MGGHTPNPTPTHNYLYGHSVGVAYLSTLFLPVVIGSTYSSQELEESRWNG